MESGVECADFRHAFLYVAADKLELLGELGISNG